MQTRDENISDIHSNEVGVARDSTNNSTNIRASSTDQHVLQLMSTIVRHGQSDRSPNYCRVVVAVFDSASRHQRNEVVWFARNELDSWTSRDDNDLLELCTAKIFPTIDTSRIQK